MGTAGPLRATFLVPVAFRGGGYRHAQRLELEFLEKPRLDAQHVTARIAL